MPESETGVVVIKQPHQLAAPKPIGDSCASFKGFSMTCGPSVTSMRLYVC